MKEEEEGDGRNWALTECIEEEAVLPLTQKNQHVNKEDINYT